MKYRHRIMASCAVLTCAWCSTGTAAAQDTTGAEPSASSSEIVVTAQKRSQSLIDVPLSVTAVTGDQLAKQGISAPSDLERVVPGFAFQPTPYGPPVFQIRGVGFFENSFAVSPAVTVYLDQVPLPFLAMTSGASLDLERLEALKGPQGTLFGQNSTGGAINYIAAKPTDHFEAGGSLTYGRFNEINGEAFVSGPLTNTVRVRTAVRTEQRDDWQRSYTRDDTLGQRNFTTGRFLVDWEPSDRARFELNLNGWVDRSDFQANQFRRYLPTVPAPRGRPEQAAFLPTVPPAPFDIRSADWDANRDLSRDNKFYQISLNGSVDIGEWGSLTSITAYSDLDFHVPTDTDGVNFPDFDLVRNGYLRSFYQELRMSGKSGPIQYMIGGNYQKDKSVDDALSANVLASNQLGPVLNPPPPAILFTGFETRNKQDVDTWAVFGSLEYQVTNTVSVQGSIRYTDQKRHYDGCLADPITGGGISTWAARFHGVPVGADNCVTYNPATNTIGNQSRDLNQDNVSWKAGISWHPTPDSLIYANVAKGYKAGSFGNLPAIYAAQTDPVTQEQLLAYEAGFRFSALDRRVQLSGAGFYYDYTDKQILGILAVPVFGSLPALVNIPQSSVRGGEVELTARPTDNLRLTMGATYVDSRVDGSFRSTDPLGNTIDIDGQPFPNTPKWQIVGDAEYSTRVSGDMKAFIGGSVKYRSSSYAAFGENAEMKLNKYALLDLRAGIENDRWRLQFWGRNVTNKRYIVNASRVADTITQQTGLPATYGVTVSYKYR